MRLERNIHERLSTLRHWLWPVLVISKTKVHNQMKYITHNNNNKINDDNIDLKSNDSNSSNNNNESINNNSDNNNNKNTDKSCD